MRLISTVLILSLVLPALVLAQSPTTYSERWEQMSAEHDRLISTSKGQNYEQQLVGAHNSFWREVYARCIVNAKKEGVEMFRAIAVIDSTGKVTQFFTLPNSQHF